MLFFLALILYITSVVGTLIFVIVIKRPPPYLNRLLISFHVLFLLLLIIYILAGNNLKDLPLVFPLSLLFFCCTGLLLFGLLINQKGYTLLKIYSSVFILTFPLFLFKPSVLIHFLLHMEIKKNGNTLFLIRDNLYLEKQNTVIRMEEGGNAYKLVKKHGMFTQTIRRDIMTGYPVDSIRNIPSGLQNQLQIMAYFTTVTGKSDSTMLEISLSTTR